jgi:hypothetical protein
MGMRGGDVELGLDERGANPFDGGGEGLGGEMGGACT